VKVAGFSSAYFFRPWRWRRYVPPKRRLTLNGLHGVISQENGTLQRNGSQFMPTVDTWHNNDILSYNRSLHKSAHSNMSWASLVRMTLPLDPTSLQSGENPASHSGGPGFECRPGHRLFWPRIFVICPANSIAIYATKVSLQILSISLFINYPTIQHYITWATDSLVKYYTTNRYLFVCQTVFLQ
jgi:hypothetical protein